jgi:hypothetical protein
MVEGRLNVRKVIQMRSLSEAQSAQLEIVREADVDWRSAKKEAEAQSRVRAADWVRDQIMDLSDARDEAVRNAVEYGVPKSTITTLGLSTTDPNTIYRILARLEVSAK